jgi:hypothetical protein
MTVNTFNLGLQGWPIVRRELHYRLVFGALDDGLIVLLERLYQLLVPDLDLQSDTRMLQNTDVQGRTCSA